MSTSLKSIPKILSLPEKTSTLFQFYGRNYHRKVEGIKVTTYSKVEMGALPIKTMYARLHRSYFQATIEASWLKYGKLTWELLEDIFICFDLNIFAIFIVYSMYQKLFIVYFNVMISPVIILLYE